ncbi:hypothetical protein NVP1081O_227 [Vibrio phage 1.081.O._10N.286.52.C2]|nr:hypothetical protein NVP1081O_227 [Vibrio phage 1.081.O._10N.286.52.C2]
MNITPEMQTSLAVYNDWINRGCFNRQQTEPEPENLWPEIIAEMVAAMPAHSHAQEICIDYVDSDYTGDFYDHLRGYGLSSFEAHDFIVALKPFAILRQFSGV